MKRNHALTLLLAAAMSPGASAAPLALAYDDSFEAADAPDYLPMFGATAIDLAPAALGGQALSFNTAGNEQGLYDQILYSTLDQGYAARRVSASFRLYTQGLIGTNNQFTVLFDTPEIRNLVFTHEGELKIVNFGGREPALIGSFTDDTVMDVRIDVDLAANTMRVELDGTLRYLDTVLTPASTFIVGLRFSHGSISATDGDPASVSWLDDVAIDASDFVAFPVLVPVPGAVWLMAGALALLGQFRRSSSLRPLPSSLRPLPSSLRKQGPRIGA